MIIHLKEGVSAKDAKKITEETEGKLIFNDQNKLIITSSKKKSIDQNGIPKPFCLLQF